MDSASGDLLTVIWQGLHASGWVPTATIGIIKSRSCTAEQPQLTRCVCAALCLCMKPCSKTSPCCRFGSEPARCRSPAQGSWPGMQRPGALPPPGSTKAL